MITDEKVIMPNKYEKFKYSIDSFNEYDSIKPCYEYNENSERILDNALFRLIKYRDEEIEKCIQEIKNNYESRIKILEMALKKTQSINFLKKQCYIFTKQQI